MSFIRYLADQQTRLKENIQRPEFRELVDPLRSLYQGAVILIPPKARPIFGRLFLLCHKGLLSAAAAILRGLPADSTPITRRVIEAAELAALIEHHPANLQAWVSFEKRMKRYEARQQGQTPRQFSPQYKKPPDDPLLGQLGLYKGLLSDGGAHVTPEFLELQTWRAHHSGEHVLVRLKFFTDSEFAIRHELVTLAVVHWQCLHVFNRVYDGAFARDEGWRSASDEVQICGKRYSEAQERESENA